MLSNGEPDPASTSDSRSGLIDPEKTCENPGKVFWVDADAVIFDRECYKRFIYGCGYPDLSAAGSVL
jgi:hypothetical protein